jgi:drug/metabolite transporter (DMT)-like permease
MPGDQQGAWYENITELSSEKHARLIEHHYISHSFRRNGVVKKERRSDLSMLLSCIFFSSTAVLVKVISGSFSSVFISGFRFITGIILGIALLKLTGGSPKVTQKKILLIRGILGMSAMLAYFMAIQMTGSGRATLLVNTFPIFVVIFGQLFFHETLSITKVLSVVFCMLGVIFVFYDGSSYSFLGNFLGLAAGIVRGFVVHLIKKSVAKNRPVIVYLAVCFIGLLLLPFSVHEAVHLSWNSFLLLVLVGTFSFTAQLLQTYGYRHATTLRGSLLSYMTIPLTVVLGFFMGEELRMRFFIGIFLILTGLFINSVKTSK